MSELKYGISETVSKLKKDKKAFITVIIGVTGMLLILLSELPLFSAEAKNTKSQETSYISGDTEKETEKLISEIKGAGKVSVMLTYDASEERVWAKDTDGKTDSEGNKNISDKHIIIDAADGETGLPVKIIYPRVRGVAVVCSGGDDPIVQGEIKALLSALFNIGSNRISIAPRAEQE